VSEDQGALALGEERIGDIERALGAASVVGVDEAGRGPLAGPVVVAAVALPLPVPAWCTGLNDSKQLSGAARAAWADRIAASGVPHAVVFVSVEEIDATNILAASLAGMRRAVEALGDSGVGPPVLCDGNRLPGGVGPEWRAIVRGDARCLSIAAASVLAKVHRDAHMVALDAQWPGYGFARHFGYPTPAHLDALRRLGPCAAHRTTFGPVRAQLGRNTG
jgi:ribonuclease HII